MKFSGCGLVLVVCTVKCSEILAHIELPKNPRVNKVFYSITDLPHVKNMHAKLIVTSDLAVMEQN